MMSTRFSSTILRGLLGGGALCIAFSLPSPAQVQSSTSVEHGAATKDVTVNRGEVVYVNGNSVVVKMEDGSLREFDNVPESVTFMVDGKPVNINNVKVGMKLEKQTVRTSTPRMVTKVETVTGKVWHVSPPNSVILTLENGQNQQFKIPKGQKFTVDGNETDAFGLKKGMRVSAQKVTQVPETVVTQEVSRTGSAPPPPPAPKQDVPILIVMAAPTQPVETAAAEPAPKALPKTASNVPLIGLLGGLFCAFSLIARAIRATSARFADL
jgi:hypothetical protein